MFNNIVYNPGHVKILSNNIYTTYTGYHPSSGTLGVCEGPFAEV